MRGLVLVPLYYLRERLVQDTGTSSVQI